MGNSLHHGKCRILPQGQGGPTDKGTSSSDSLFSEAEKKARILVGKRLKISTIRTQIISQIISKSLILVNLFQ